MLEHKGAREREIQREATRRESKLALISAISQGAEECLLNEYI